MTKTRILLPALLASVLAAGAQQRTQSIGVRTAVVAVRDVRASVTSVASVVTDEATETDVTSRFTGWVERVYADTSFQSVRRGQPLLTVYSPDLYAAEQEYLFAVRNRRTLAASAVPGVAAGAAALLADARARLQQQQVPAAEIARLQKTGVALSRVTITAPETGVVIERDALPQMRVEPGTRLYQLAALSPIWVVAQVNESDLGRVRAGQAATVTLDAFPGRAFAARVALVVPRVDAASRTGQVRLVLANRDRRLSPGMYGSVRIAVPIGRRLVIPADAVLQTGTRALAFVAEGGGRFDPVPVVLGPQVGDEVVVAKGLRPGQRIAAGADFLIDSESQLSAAAASYAPPPPGVGANAAPTPAARYRVRLTTAPSPARVGANQFRVRLTDAHGAGVAGARVTVTLFLPAMPEMGMAALRTVVVLASQGGGNYQGSGPLGSGGIWQVTIVATRQGQLLARQRTTLPAGGGM